MANDVTIVVEADVAAALVKLDLVKHAINDVGDESEQTAAKQDAAALSTTLLTSAVGGWNDAMATSLPLIGEIGPFLQALPVIAVGAAVGVVALADAVGTLVAIASAFVAPLSLITGLLGLLGIGFGLAAKRAADGGGTLSQFSQKLDTLHSMFSKTTDILAHAFLPYLLRLADAAQKALLFIDKLASGSLTNAFRMMSTQGVQMLNQFIQDVAHVLAHPIRIAFKIAFGGGKGTNEIASAVAGWWHQFTDYLLGYTNTHKAHIGRWLGPMTKTQVDGVLQPLLDWFNRHHFEKDGRKIGHELLNGLKPLVHPIGQFIVSVFVDAFKTVAKAFWDMLNPWSPAVQHVVRQINGYIKQEIGQAFDWVLSKAQQIWNRIGSVGRGVIITLAGLVAGPLVGAWSAVQGAVNIVVGLINNAIGAVHTLIGILGHAADIAGSIASAVGGGSSNSTAGRTGQGGNSPGRPNVVPNAARGMVNHFHFHGAQSSSDPSFRRAAREVAREIGRQNHLLAGGS